MFNSISWSEYLGFLVLLLIVYYLFVGVKFYSFELLSLIKGKRTLPPSLATQSFEDRVQERNNYFHNIQSELSPSDKRYAPQVEETDDMVEKVEELTAKLKEVVADAVSKNFIKEEFILSLQILLKNYPFFKGSPFLEAINNLIASECDKYGFIHLSAEELAMLWN